MHSYIKIPIIMNSSEKAKAFPSLFFSWGKKKKLLATGDTTIHQYNF